MLIELKSTDLETGAKVTGGGILSFIALIFLTFTTGGNSAVFAIDFFGIAPEEDTLVEGGDFTGVVLVPHTTVPRPE